LPWRCGILRGTIAILGAQRGIEAERQSEDLRD
jgi:hypothetical protein